MEDRLARLTWAAVALSDGGYVGIEQGFVGERAKQSRVTVRAQQTQYTARSTPSLDGVNAYESLVVAMDRAVAWLRQQAWGS